MSTLKRNVAAGAALVALSGAVPLPYHQRVYAASATINATGVFTGGVSVAPGQILQAGSIVATGPTGNFRITAGGAVAGTNNALLIGAAQQAVFTYSLLVTGSVRMSVTQGIGPIAPFAPTNVTLDRVTFVAANLNGGNSFQFAATGVIQTISATSTAPGLTIGMGVRISWSGGRPIGAFSQTVGMFLSF